MREQAWIDRCHGGDREKVYLPPTEPADGTYDPKHTVHSGHRAIGAKRRTHFTEYEPVAYHGLI